MGKHVVIEKEPGLEAAVGSAISPHADRILIAEDNLGDYRTIKNIIRSLYNERYLIDHSEDGQNALKKLQEDNLGSTKRYKLLISDGQMPNLGGLEMVARMRMDYIGTPVIFVTSANPETIRTTIAPYAEALGASYVPKNQMQQDLPNLLRQLLG